MLYVLFFLLQGGSGGGLNLQGLHLAAQGQVRMQFDIMSFPSSKLTKSLHLITISANK